MSASSGIGQHQRPAVVVEDLHAVDEDDVAARRALDHLPHHRALALPRRGHGLVRDVDVGADPRRPSDSVRSVDREQVEQLHQRGGGVVGGEEVGPDEAAVVRRREVDPRRSTPPPSGAGADSFVHTISAPCSAAMRSASRLTDDRQRDAGAGHGPRPTSVDQREQRLLVRRARGPRRR